MRKQLLLVGLLFMGAIACAQTEPDKSYSGVIKAEIAGVASEVNFYQVGYEFQIEDNSSFQLSAGFGSENEVNVYALGIQNRYYLGHAVAPEGLHLGPRLLAIYAESNRTNLITNSKDTAFGFELDAIFGYQFLIAELLTLDPYIGAGLAVINSETQVGVVFGGTVGFAF